MDVQVGMNTMTGLGAPVRTVTTLAEVPLAPAVYALYGRRGTGVEVAYVGKTGQLQKRLGQHLERRDSSATTGVSVVCLKPELVTEVQWWTQPAFSDATTLEAAELVASTALDPVMRSRGNSGLLARAMSADPAFLAVHRELFGGVPSGRLVLPSRTDAHARIQALEGRVAALEALLRQQAERPVA